MVQFRHPMFGRGQRFGIFGNGVSIRVMLTRASFFIGAGAAIPGGTGGTRPPPRLCRGDRPPGKFEKVQKNNVQQILTKDCNTLLGFGGPRVQRLDK